MESLNKEEIRKKIKESENTFSELRTEISTLTKEKAKMEKRIISLDGQCCSLKKIIDGFKKQLSQIEELEEKQRSLDSYDGLVVGYCRESRGHNDSASQSGQIRSYCKGAIIFSDVISGMSSPMEREGFKNMVSFISMNKVNLVVANSVERIARSEEYLFNGINAILEHSEIFFLRENIHIANTDDLSKWSDTLKDIALKSTQEIVTLKMRLDEGRRIAMGQGVRLGRKPGWRLGNDGYIKKYPEAIILLNKGLSIRKVARLANISPNTVKRIKNAVKKANA